MKVPIIYGVDAEKVQSFYDFVAALREDPAKVADIEAARLLPYLDEFSKVLKSDIENYHLGAEDIKGEQTEERLDQLDLFMSDPVEYARKRVEALASKGAMSELFSDIYRKTGNVILSEMMIAPESIVKTIADAKNIKQFSKVDNFAGFSIRLGFFQVYPDAPRTGNAQQDGGNVSAPLIAIDDKILGAVDGKMDGRLLEILQSVMLAGNHDMQHHYTNDTLNQAIAERNKLFSSRASTHDLSIGSWAGKFFSRSVGDEDISSYESWLLMNHARVMQAGVEKGGRQILEHVCDEYYAELEELSHKLYEDNTTSEKYGPPDEIIDYLGTVLPYALMRFLPMDDPLMDRCCEALEKILRPPQHEIVHKARFLYSDGHTFQVTSNYKIAGRALVPDSLHKCDFKGLKKLQLIKMAPEIPLVISPAEKGSSLEEIQQRVGRVNVEMVSNAAHNVWFSPVRDGIWTTVDEGGATIEIYTKDGMPHREDGPAIIWKKSEYEYKELYCRNGVLHRGNDEPAVIHRVAYPAKINKEYFDNGKYIRQDNISLVDKQFYDVETAAKRLQREKEIESGDRFVLFTSRWSDRRDEPPQRAFNFYSSSEGEVGVKIEIPKNLQNAREYFQELETRQNAPEILDVKDAVYILESYLKKEGLDFDALDPTGESSVEEMRARVDKHSKRLHLIKARDILDALEKDDGERTYIETNKILLELISNLDASGADYSALDPTGNSTKEEMGKRVDDAAKRREIMMARRQFKNIQSRVDMRDRLLFDTAHPIRDMEQSIRRKLATAGVGFEALDETGEKTAEEMEAELKVVCQSALVDEAKKAYQEVVKFHSSYAKEILTVKVQMIKDTLVEAGVDHAVLDETGEKSSKDIEDYLKKLVDEAKYIDPLVPKMPIGENGPFGSRSV